MCEDTLCSGLGKQIELDCSAYSGTKLILPCPIRDQDQLTARAQDQLPDPLEVSGGYDTGDGRFAATSSFTGVFMLVTK
jgi:hypothetical protein